MYRSVQKLTLTYAKIRIHHIFDSLCRIHTVGEGKNHISEYDAHRKAQNYQNSPLLVPSKISPCHISCRMAGMRAFLFLSIGIRTGIRISDRFNRRHLRRYPCRFTSADLHRDPCKYCCADKNKRMRRYSGGVRRKGGIYHQ